jgi:hypothetical protein
VSLTKQEQIEAASSPRLHNWHKLPSVSSELEAPTPLAPQASLTGKRRRWPSTRRPSKFSDLIGGMVAHVAKDGLDAQDCFCWLDELSLRFGRMLAPEAGLRHEAEAEAPRQRRRWRKETGRKERRQKL